MCISNVVHINQIGVQISGTIDWLIKNIFDILKIMRKRQSEIVYIDVGASHERHIPAP
jgi:hypothetical protein